MDKTQLAGELLMLSGALHDIAEQTCQPVIKNQINDITKKLEYLTVTNFADVVIPELYSPLSF